eukprot:Skav218014  [mRNA]  locus=scaffold2344:200916:212011:- [translate_table: standard]
MKFHNSTSSERLQQVKEAELQLEVQTDGDSLCRLVNCCAAWLRPGMFWKLQGASSENSGSITCPNLQHRIRKVLIKALKRLDLDDFVTFQRVETALNHIKTLLTSLEDLLSAKTSSNARQWKRLATLLPENSNRGPRAKRPRVAAKHNTEHSTESTTVRNLVSEVIDLDSLFRKDPGLWRDSFHLTDPGFRYFGRLLGDYVGRSPCGRGGETWNVEVAIGEAATSH